MLILYNAVAWLGVKHWQRGIVLRQRDGSREGDGNEGKGNRGLGGGEGDRGKVGGHEGEWKGRQGEGYLPEGRVGPGCWPDWILSMSRSLVR